MKRLAILNGAKWMQDFKQGDEKNLIKLTSVTAKGVCLAHCGYWLKNKREIGHDEHFKWLQSVKGKTGTINTFAALSSSNWRKNFAGEFGLTVRFDFPDKKPISATDLWYIITAYDMTAVLINVWNGTTGHAVAASYVLDTVFFFDPNYGEARWAQNKELFFQFLVSYLKDRGQGLGTFTQYDAQRFTYTF